MLLSSYAAQNTDKVKSTTVDKIDKSERKLKVAQAKLKQLANKSKLDKSGDDESKKDLELDRKKDKDFCGKCPICDIYHTFNRRKDGEKWPSDCLSSCEQFRKLSQQERGKQVEDLSACARCLSWHHNRDSDSCKAPKNSCGRNNDDELCSLDHSKMVCKSGVAYCASARFSLVQSDSVSKPDGTESVLLLQDVDVQQGVKKSKARVLWAQVVIEHLLLTS